MIASDVNNRGDLGTIDISDDSQFKKDYDGVVVRQGIYTRSTKFSEENGLNLMSPENCQHGVGIFNKNKNEQCEFNDLDHEHVHDTVANGI